MRYSRISAGCHVDLPWIPPDLFTAHALAALRPRMPYVTDGPDGPYWTARNGLNFGLVNGVGPSGQKFVPAATTEGPGGAAPVAPRQPPIQDGERSRALPPVPNVSARRTAQMNASAVEARPSWRVLVMSFSTG